MKPARRIIRLLSSGRVTIEKRRRLEDGLWGWCDYENRTLYIYRRLCEKTQVRILIHESLHFLHPSESEDWVLNREEVVFNELLPAEFSELVRILGQVR